MKPSNIKEWLQSSKVLTAIVWILFPLGHIPIVITPNYDIPIFGITRIGKVPIATLLSKSSAIVMTKLQPIYIPPVSLLTVLVTGKERNKKRRGTEKEKEKET